MAEHQRIWLIGDAGDERTWCDAPIEQPAVEFVLASAVEAKLAAVRQLALEALNRGTIDEMLGRAVLALAVPFGR